MTTTSKMKNAYFPIDSVIASNCFISNAISNFDFDRVTVFPGFCDVHVHFREPGFSYKETIETGSKAAARGGYTDVCTMPNLNPVPDSVEHLKQQLQLIEERLASMFTPMVRLPSASRARCFLTWKVWRQM